MLGSWVRAPCESQTKKALYNDIEGCIANITSALYQLKKRDYFLKFDATRVSFEYPLILTERYGNTFSNNF